MVDFESSSGPESSSASETLPLKEEVKVDPITELQDDIDGLLLAIFEALRSLRDAVAPESGNLGGTKDVNNESSEDIVDDLWSRYRSGEKEVIAMIQKASGGILPQKREDFIRIHAKMEMEKDTELVMKLASKVLSKSALIDEHVDALPGMNRTRSEQMHYIEELVDLNQTAIQELDSAYAESIGRRDACRAFIQTNTCSALGIEEEREDD